MLCEMNNFDYQYRFGVDLYQTTEMNILNYQYRFGVGGGHISNKLYGKRSHVIYDMQLIKGTRLEHGNRSNRVPNIFHKLSKDLVTTKAKENNPSY